MGWLTNLTKGVRKVAHAGLNAVRTVSSVPGLNMIPVVAAAGLAAKGIGAASALQNSFGGGSGSAGASPGLLPTGMPAFPAYASAQTVPSYPVPGGISTQVATRGSYAMPSLDINTVNSLTAAGLMIGFNQLRHAYKSPSKHHVVVHPLNPATGQRMTFALHKKLARAWGLWKPSAKPPISAGDWRSIQRANAVVKKIRSMNSDIKKVANFGARAVSRPVVAQLPGKNIIVQRRK